MPDSDLSRPEQSSASGVRKLGGAALAAAGLAGLYWLSQSHYLLFHSVIEGYSTVIAFAIFIQCWNARRYMDSAYLVFLGIAYLFVGLLDLLHALAYQGMGVFSVQGANLPTQLWVAARYLESLSILISFILIGRKPAPYFTLAAFAIVTSLMILSIFYWHTFPDCYLTGLGLTAFKKVSEYVISAVLLVAIIVLYRKRQTVDSQVRKLLYWSIVMTIFAELALSAYTSVYGFSNMLGHLFKIVSFYLLYKAIVVPSFTKPLDLLFHEVTRQDLKLKEDLATIKALEKEREAVLSMLVHDMKTPLVSIKGFCSLLLKKQNSLGEDKFQQYTNIIFRQSEQLEKLILDFLDSARSGDARLPLNLEDVDLAELVRDAAQGFGARCEKNGQRIETNFQEPVAKASVDRARLQRALGNLIDNAIRFSPANGKIFVRLFRKNQAYLLEVEDQGPGIAEDDLAKLFTPFFRGKKQADPHGYGLGLAGVKTIVESHGGKIKVRNNPTGGAVFTIILPAGKQP